MRKIVTSLFMFVALLVFIGGANATLTTFTDRTAFKSQGTIAFNYGFEDFTGSSFYWPGNPWTTHGVTYTAVENFIVDPAAGHGNASNVISGNWGMPLPGTINDQYTMFGFDLGVLNITSTLDLVVATNLNSYAFNALVVPNLNTHTMNFYGFVGLSGEYLTGFSISSPVYGSAPAIDNVTVGNVPLPASILLLGSGLLRLACYRRKLKKS